MPQSLANVLIHIVFSTKDRRPLFQNLAVRNETHAVRMLLKKHRMEYDERYLWD